MRALNRVFRAKTINTQRRGVAFSIRQLFANSEPGVWYDPSDLSTLYQDAAGTTPVTAVEQPVGLMLDKSKGLVLGPELVTNGDFSQGATGWVPGVSWAITDGKAVKSGVGTDAIYQDIAALTIGKFYKIELDQTYTGGGPFSILLRVGSGGAVAYYTILPAVNGRVSIVVNAVAAATRLSFFMAGDVFTGSIDNISVRELPGNHAYQTTATSRPVLSARVNLLTKTEQFDDAAWTKDKVTVTQNTEIAPDGTMTADTLTDNVASGEHRLYQSVANAATHFRGIYAKAGTASFISLTSGTVMSGYAVFDLSNGTVVSQLNAVGSITSVGNGWYLCSTNSTPVGQFHVINMGTTATNAIPQNPYVGSGSTVYIWGASLVPANQAHLPYQRVNTATDYDTAGFPHYLRFDGVDDGLVTSTITPGTDRAQVFAGVRKLSDAAIGTVLGLGASLPTRGFEVFESDTGAGSGSNNTSFNVVMGNASFFNGDAAPFSRIAAILLDRSLPRATETSIRSNGNNKTLTILGSDATSTFLDYPLYIGRRGGTSLPFNGHIYSLIVRFGNNLPIETIEKTEKYINGLTKAY